MANGKRMDQNCIISEKAVRFIQSILPPQWVTRKITPDFGIDLDVELFDYEDEKCITLGEHLFLQIKGTEHPQYGTFMINGEEIDVVKYQLEVSELNLVERMGSAFPVLLVLVDLGNKKAFQICLNDYIRKILPIQKPMYRKQETVVINIPIVNEVSAEHVEALKWYGKRTKIYSMFHEMMVDIEDFNYMDNEDLVAAGKIFVDHYRKYDVFNDDNIWSGLNYIKSMLDNLYKNDYILEKEVSFVQHALGYTDNWEFGEVFEGNPLTEEEINAYLCAQKLSIKNLGEVIRDYSGVFEVYCREWFMPGLALGVHNK